MYVNRPVTPAFLTSNARPIQYPGPQPQVMAAPYSPYNTSQATSDVMVNIKALATNVWTWLKNFFSSAMATLKSASQPHA
jgi:hypothetical protein